MANSAILFASLFALVLLYVNTVDAHSWLGCADYRGSVDYYDDTKCYAYPRNWETARASALTADSKGYNLGADTGYNYQATETAACNLPLKNPVDSAYTTNYPKAVYEQGNTYCLAWPMKNHAAATCTNQYIPDTSMKIYRSAVNPTSDPTQTVFKQNRVSDNFGVHVNGVIDCLGFQRSPKFCENTDRALGTGCFTVPADQPVGNYIYQWYWIFNEGTQPYTTCWDAQVVAAGTGRGAGGLLNSASISDNLGAGGSTCKTNWASQSTSVPVTTPTPPTTSTGTTPVNCVVSAWSDWSVCSADCGGGTQTRTRTITTERVGTGTACPTLTGSQSCNTGTCTNYLSAHVVYADALTGFTDWSWADSTKYSKTATTPVHAGSKSIKWTPYAWQAVFFHSSTVLNTRDYQSISFWIHGGTTGGQSITFSLVTSGATSSTQMFRYPIPTTSIKKNAWTQVSLKFVDLGFASSTFDGFWWQANSASQQGTVYIDDVYFQHVHAGGPAALETPDLCAAVTCPASHSVCLAGSCACTDGYTDEDCSTPPTITDVTIQSLEGAFVSTLTADETLSITWNSTGAIFEVSLVLYTAGNSIPETIASQISNAESYTWTVPSTLAAGSYTVRVSYSSAVYADSASLTKSTSAESTACTSDCSGHGTCDEDTAPLCICRFGWGPAENCSTEPAGISRTRSKIIVKQAYSTYAGSPARFLQVVRADLATALLVHQDQIETVSAESGSSAASTAVTFDVLTGAQFGNSSLAITDTASLDAIIGDQLGTSDSSLSRGTYQYQQEASVSGDMSGVNDRRSSPVSLLAVAVAMLAASLL